MPTTTAAKIEALVPDPRVRSAMLAIFAGSTRYILERSPDRCLVRFTERSLRLFAGRLIVLTLHPEAVWLATDPVSSPIDLSTLQTWRWDTTGYAEYRRIPSRNGYYIPELQDIRDWPHIRRAHLAFLEKALTPGVAADHRTAAQHDAEAMTYILDTALADSPFLFLFDTTAVQAGSPARSSPSPEGTSFTHAQVFPMIARLILQAARRDPTAFVTHTELVDLLLTDSDTANILARAQAVSAFTDGRSVASNMVAWFSQQVGVGASEWIEFFERKRLDGAWAYRPAPTVMPALLPEAELRALEGEPRMFFHVRRERDPRLVRAKRDASRSSDGTLECEACGFISELEYPGLATDVCEVHHRRPLSEATGTVDTSLTDLAILCPNCHRAIHQTRPMMTLEAFREHRRKRTGLS